MEKSHLVKIEVEERVVRLLEKEKTHEESFSTVIYRLLMTSSLIKAKDKISKLEEEYEDLKDGIDERVRKELERKGEEYKVRAQSVINGKVIEQIAPFLPNFPCAPQEFKFLGQPIDGIAFPGMSLSTEGKSITSIRFVEVKTNTASLTNTQRRLKQLVQAKEVYWDEFRINTTRHYTNKELLAMAKEKGLV